MSRNRRTPKAPPGPPSLFRSTPLRPLGIKVLLAQEFGLRFFADWWYRALLNPVMNNGDAFQSTVATALMSTFDGDGFASKHVEFRTAFTRRLLVEFAKGIHPTVCVDTDYEPGEILRDVLKEVSASPDRAPWKTRTRVGAGGLVSVVSLGHGWNGKLLHYSTIIPGLFNASRWLHRVCASRLDIASTRMDDVCSFMRLFEEVAEASRHACALMDVSNRFEKLEAELIFIGDRPASEESP